MTQSDVRRIDFYFDFISPFGFFASLRIDDLAERHGYSVNWSSMLVGVSVLKVMGLKPIPQTPLKGDYARRDAERYCRRHGIRLGRPYGIEPSNPLAAGRCFHWVKAYAPGKEKAVARAILAAYWLEGRDIGDQDVVLDLAAAQGVDRAALSTGFATGRAAELLRTAVDASLARGVFGSPFFLVGDEPFFGVEKMELLEEWLREGGW